MAPAHAGKQAGGSLTAIEHEPPPNPVVRRRAMLQHARRRGRQSRRGRGDARAARTKAVDAPVKMGKSEIEKIRIIGEKVKLINRLI